MIYLFGFSISSFSQAIDSTLCRGNWTDALIWSKGLPPLTTDSVIIKHNIILNVNVIMTSPGTIYISSIGELCGDSNLTSSLIIDGKLNIGTLIVYGNSINNNIINATNSITVISGSFLVNNGTGTSCAGCPFTCKPIVPCVFISSQNLLCKGQCTGTATAAAAGGISPYTYFWNPTVATNATATGLCAGSYTVIVTDAAASTTTATIAITQPTALSAIIGSTPAPGGTATVIPSGGTSSYTYLWNTPPQQTTQTATGLAAGVYCCTITDANNCTEIACVTVTVEPMDCSGELYLPNAFSPNSDGANDEFCPQGGMEYCIKELTIIIYDRWGEKVYTSTDPKFCWDGTYQGKLLNTAVFVYYMKTTLISGEQVTQGGNISLIK